MVDKVSSVLFKIVILVALFIGFVEYIHSSEGRELFSMLMGSYPFAAQIVKVTKNVVGFKEKIPIVTTSSFSFDIVKLLISALIKSAVVSVLLRIFCAIPDFSESQLYKWGIDRIDAQEKYMKGISYQFRVLLVNVVASVIIVFISNEIFKALYTYMELHLSKIMITVFAVTGAVFTMLFYIIIFSRSAGIALATAVSWVFLGKIFPKVLDVFGLNVICLLLYMSIYTNGFSTGSIGIGIVLLLWCACADIVQKSLLKITIGH